MSNQARESSIDPLDRQYYRLDVYRSIGTQQRNEGRGAPSDEWHEFACYNNVWDDKFPFSGSNLSLLFNARVGGTYDTGVFVQNDEEKGITTVRIADLWRLVFTKVSYAEYEMNSV